MSTGNERDALRRALRLADGIEPSTDGLQRIQARLRPPRPAAVAWAEGAWTYARTRVPDDLQRLWEWLRSLASLAWQWLRSAASLAWERFGPSGVASGRRASRGNGWLRPVAVLGVTIFVVAVGTYVAIDAQQGLSPSASNALGNTGTGSGPGGSRAGNAGTNAQSPSAFPPYRSSPSASPTCIPAKSGGTAPPTPTTTPTSPSASPSATSSSPSPSPSLSGTASPAVTPATQSSLSASGADIPATTADTIADSVLQTRVSASPTPSPCATKKLGHRSSGLTTPNPSTAVIHFGKLNDGS